MTQPLTEPHLAAWPWLWILFDRQFDPNWLGHDLKFPRHPVTTPAAEILPSLASSGTSEIGLLDFVACSCNVLTLRSEQAEAGPLGLSRLSSLLKQFDEVKCAFFGLQETRSRRSMANTQDDYVLISGEASPQGQGGVLIGLSRRHPHGFLPTPTGDQPVCFSQESYSVIASSPRLLVLRLQTAVLRVILINAHAPHSGASLDEIHAWWDTLYSLIPQRYTSWPLLLLCDANARVGAHVSVHAGDHQAEPYNEKAIPFLDFLAQAQVFLPSTFVDFHTGTAGTWKHPTAGWRRNDFIGLPLAWDYQTVQSWVALEIDPTLHHEDHRAVCVHLRCPGNGRPQLRLQHRPKITYEELQEVDWQQVHRSLPTWDVDVHTHYHAVQAALVSQATTGPRLRQPLKQTMTAKTWELVQLKRECRVALHEANHIQRRTYLMACFSGWVGAMRHPGPRAADEWTSVLCTQDTLIAQLLFEFRRLGRLVTAALRSDDRAFFASLSSRASEFLHPSDIRQFWQVIRSTLPKFKQRRTQHQPLKIEILEDQWLPYFEQLELGSETTPTELIDLCGRFQATHGSQFATFEPEELPSLFDLEREMRATRAHRATGFDSLPSQFYHTQSVELAKTWYPLLLKQYLWQMEPLQSKGGQMTMIPKAGGLKAAGYRGIMLLENFGKRMHALVRKALVAKLLPVKPLGQLGGFPKQQAPFGAQCLQTFGRLTANANLSSAVVFVDLANAFHRLIRELVSGATYDPDVEHILTNLADGSAQGVQAWLQLPALLTRLGVSEKLTVLLQDIHMCTWMTIADTGRFCRTRRGSRPGSPLADVVFHVLMLGATYAIEQWLADREDYQSCLRDLGITIGAVVWSDDLAVPFCCRQPHDLPLALEDLMHCIMDVFHRRGFDLNIAKHKTSAVVSFRGLGASKLRTQYNLAIPAGMPIAPLATQPGFFLHFVPVYKHLGIMFSADGSLRAELNHRLVCTRLFYGLGIWPAPSTKDLERLQHCVGRHLRAILFAGRALPDRFPTDADVFHQARFPLPRVRLAVDRLLYAQSVFSNGPGFLRDMLHAEHAQMPIGSWLSGLLADLAWAHAIQADVVPEKWLESLTPAFEFWEEHTSLWKSGLKKVLRKHLHQERMMHQVHGLHRMIFKTLQHGGALLRPDPLQSFDITADVPEYTCFCGKSFAKPQGLALHKLKVHKTHAPEFAYRADATCPACLRHFWSSQRLAQHLSYISRCTGRNECFQQLAQSGFNAEAESISFPPQVQGLNRVDAIQACGPLPLLPSACEARIQDALARQQALRTQLEAVDEPLPGLFDVSAGCTKALQDWFQVCQNEGHPPSDDPIADRWLAVLSELPPLFHDWACLEFLRWGQQVMPDLLDALEDGEASYYLDNAFADLLTDFPIYNLKQEIAYLGQHVRYLQTKQASDVPHREIRTGTANTRERTQTYLKVPSRFCDQEQCRQIWRSWSGMLCRIACNSRFARESTPNPSSWWCTFFRDADDGEIFIMPLPNSLTCVGIRCTFSPWIQRTPRPLETLHLGAARGLGLWSSMPRGR